MRPGSLVMILAGLLAWIISFRLKRQQWKASQGQANGQRLDWTSWS